MSKALLTLPFKTATSETTTFELTIVSYTIGYQSQLGSSGRRLDRQHYPIRLKEVDINLTIQCRSMTEYDEIRKTIAIVQQLSLYDINRSFVRLSYPALNLDYLGFIPSIEAGTQRFVQAPKLSFVLSLFRDTINTITNQYSETDGTWKDIAGDDLVQIGKSQGDTILQGTIPNPTTGVGWP